MQGGNARILVCCLVVSTVRHNETGAAGRRQGSRHIVTPPHPGKECSRQREQVWRSWEQRGEQV